MHDLLIVKTAALGDVLRTTSILEGLHLRHAPARVAWATAPGAVDLVRTHPRVERVVAVDTKDARSLEAAARELGATRWTRIVSLDDEEPLCRLVAGLRTDALTGATLDAEGRRVYTDDAAPWFDMGLLSRFGKAEADRLKVVNTRSQPAIYAAMLGIEMGRPALHLPEPARAFAADFRAKNRLEDRRPLVGLNTSAGGRWVSKQLSEERTVEFARALSDALGGRATFVLLGGDAESDRNGRIRAGLERARVAFVDAGTRNPLLEFAAIVAGLDLLVTSDSLALHMAVAAGVRVVVFFAPTSAAEIELYGRGEKVVSTAPDYCSYKPDADNASITVPRLLAAALRQLERTGARR